MINKKAIKAANFLCYVYPVVMLDTLLLRFSLHFTHLYFTQLHFTTLLFGLTPFKFPTTPFHFTSLHYVLLYCINGSCIPAHVLYFFLQLYCVQTYFPYSVWFSLLTALLCWVSFLQICFVVAL
jgi:hypothetical protein